MKKGLKNNRPLFSVVVVALNPGEKWRETLRSIFLQKYDNFEVLYKDGQSRDGSWEALAEEYGADLRLRAVQEKDKSIYDAMNQALDRVRGKYVLFLNCGDIFYDDRVLMRTAETIAAEEALGKAEETEQAGKAAAREPGGRTGRPAVFYGNTFSVSAGAAVHSAPVITGFTCYRNIPCHQSCFYDAKLFEEKRYDPQYRIRADYDHFLWCYYRGNARMIYMDFVVASYEGGGYSESRENKARDREEHKIITGLYMGRGERLRYRAALALTLAPLRRFMAESKAFSGPYHKMKDLLYRRK